MNLNHFYHYYKSKSGGVSNLLLGSEELDQSDQGEWVRYNMNAVNANIPGVANPLSSDETVEQLDFEASRTARIAQTVTLTAGTEYTFSVWARAASGTKPFRLRYWDNVGGSGGGSAFTASATWSASTGRYEMTFTAQNSGTFQVFIQNAADGATRRIYFWGAMLNVGATALDYVKTEFPIGLSNPPTPPMEFGDNFAGVTAYYSLRRFTKGEDNNAIRVRRSSDDTEQDIGFDANGDLDTTALTTFVNEDVNLFTSDYSSGGVAEPTRSNFTVTIDETKEGKTECLKAVWDGTSPAQLFKFNFLPTEQGVTFNVSAEFYIEGFTGIRMGANGNAPTLDNRTNQWATYDSDIIVNNTNDDFVVSVNGGTSGSTVWLKNIVITQTTADGAVTTFYDQSGNGNNAINATASEQPLVVSGGTLVTENGKAALDFDGVDDVLTLPASIGAPFTGQGKAVSSFSVSSIVSGNRTLWSITGTGNDDYYFSSHDSSRFKFFARGGSGTLKSSTSSNTFGAGQYLKSDILPEEAASVQNGDMYIDGTQEVTSFDYATATKTLDRGGGIGALVRSSVSGNFNGKHQEIILFASDQSSNRTGIESNINDHFSIYTP